MNFWIGAGLLCALAMLFVLAPWLLRGVGLGGNRRGDRRRTIIAIAKARLVELEREYADGTLSEADYHQLTLEQQRRLLQEVGTAPTAGVTRQGRFALLICALALPVAAGAFYFHFGSWTDWEIQRLLDQSEREIQAGSDNRTTLEALAGALQRRLAQRDDDDGRRRFMLARIESEFGRYNVAVAQFALLLKQFPDDPNIAAQYAQALYLAADRTLTGEAQTQARRALQLDPDQTTALGLLGIAAFEAQDYAQALQHWRRLVQLLPPGSQNVAMIGHGIRQAEQALGGAAEAPAPVAASTGPRLVVSVSMAPELAAARPQGGTLFVFAKAVAGPPMPLAVARLDPARLPLEVTLDDSMAMAPGVNLSSAKEVQVFARITASGQVRGEPGDFEGSSAPLALNGEAKLSLRIDRKL